MVGIPAIIGLVSLVLYVLSEDGGGYKLCERLEKGRDETRLDEVTTSGSSNSKNGVRYAMPCSDFFFLFFACSKIAHANKDRLSFLDDGDSDEAQNQLRQCGPPSYNNK